MRIDTSMLWGVKVIQPQSVVMMDSGAGDMFWNGIRVIVNAHCLRRAVKHTIERIEGRKRRKRFLVARWEWDQPHAYRLSDGAMVIHPILWEQLKAKTR